MRLQRPTLPDVQQQGPDMAALECFQVPYASDNYAVLIHDPDSGQTACVDAGEAQPVLDALRQKGWSLSHILVTHHHADHTAGVAQVKRDSSCLVVGPVERSQPISAIDKHVDDGDTFEFAGRLVRAIHTPGHTIDMINYYIEDDKLLFTGDTLFSMGCGRLFEGDATLMLSSVKKLMSLPDDTLVYCAHEYTATNAKFALDVDPENTAVKERAAEVTRLRAVGQPTVPTVLSLERATNPFLRFQNPGIRKELDMAEDDDVAVFSELRERRNRY